MQKKESSPLEILGVKEEDNKPMPNYMSLSEVFLNNIIDNPFKYNSTAKDYDFMAFYNSVKEISDLCVATQAYNMFALRRAEHIKALESIHLLDVPVLDKPMAVMFIVMDSLESVKIPIEQATLIVFWMPIVKYFADKAKLFYDQIQEKKEGSKDEVSK